MAKKNGKIALVCDMCTSNDFVKENGLFVCQHCGTKYTVEEAKKMMVEGTVKIDGPVEVSGTMTLEKMVQNGETFINLGKMDDALRVFTEITEKYPEDYRGWWGKARVYSNNLCSLATDEFPDGTVGINGYMLAEERDYVTNNEFYEAWQTALAVAPKGKKYDEVHSKGKSYLDLHRKNNCKKEIDRLLEHQECKTLVELHSKINKLNGRVALTYIGYFVEIALFILFVILTLINLFGRVIGDGNWNRIWLVLLFGFLAYVFFGWIITETPGMSKASRECYSAKIEADEIEFHENNLKMM